jgi:hypothetical protein
VIGGSPRAAVAVALAGAALVTGCTRDPETRVPVECREGTQAVREALRAAPADVRLEGTPLSDCLVRSSDAGDLQAVGTAFVDVASELAVAAKRESGGHQAVQLGYLVGAARRGADAGVHDELIRRIEQELIGVDTRSPAFRRGEERGRAAG